MPTEAETEYLPCPFPGCGGEAQEWSDNNKAGISCFVCGCSVTVQRDFMANFVDVLAAVRWLWNTRAPVPEPEMDPRIMKLLKEIEEKQDHHFTCPDCGGHRYRKFTEAGQWKAHVRCLDQHRTRCTWSGPYGEWVK